MDSKQAEIIIVGAGVSALVAASELVARGHRVFVYDKRSRADYGGQCNWAFGGFFFADSAEQRRFRIADSAELAWRDWQSYAEFGPDSQYQRWWARRYVERCVPDVHDWITNRGMRFFPAPNWAERAHGGKGNTVPRFHLLWGCGPELSQNLRQGLADHEDGLLRLHFEHEVTELVRTGDAVTGIRGRTASGAEFEATAPVVVIASGGFTGNLDEVCRNWPAEWGRRPEPGELLRGIWPEIDGTMHRAAERAGARLVDLDNMWVYAAGVEAWRDRVPQLGYATIPMKSALWLKADGSRFDPPLVAGLDTREAVTRIAHQPQRWSWSLSNRRIALREFTIQGSEFNPSWKNKTYRGVGLDLVRGNRQLLDEFIDRCPDVVTAETLDELADKMERLAPGVDRAALARDVAAYDAQVRAGSRLYTDDQLVSLKAVRGFLNDRLRTANFSPIVEPGQQLIAIRHRLTIRKSLGGIHTDGACRVLDSGGAPVAGLFAIGEAAGFGGGGMNGKRTLEGTLLGGCVLTARELVRSNF